MAEPTTGAPVHEGSRCVAAIETGTDIAAPPWWVWRLLTDFDAYPGVPT